MKSRLEELLVALNNGEPIDYECNSRLEEHLVACINGTGKEGLGEPKCRAEELLQVLAEKMKNGNIPIEVKYIPVPNHEEIENVYFNINMTPEEVDTYLDNAGLTDIVPSDEGWSYSIFDDDYEHSIALTKLNMGELSGYVLVANTEVIMIIAYISPSLEVLVGELVPDNPFTGWNPDLIAVNGVVGVNDEARYSTPTGNPSGTQNDLIAKLVNIGTE